MTRVLDLGCHDGFTGMWLRQQMPDVELYGIELNSRACDVARKRGYQTVAHAHAEDAPEHFPERSFDLVVAYELIEHVPDVDRLLDVCERMVKPDGRILISTPDGVFGEGNNPHHLRAYRTTDLAEMLRRRGRLQNMVLGPDRIAVASYTPQPRKSSIDLYLGPSWMRWSPLDIVQRGLGGSETAAVRVAEGLSGLGHLVTVYGDVEDGCYSDVVYRHHTVFDPAEHRGALIVSRLPQVFDRPVNADRTMLWCHDVDCGPALTPQRAERIDQVLVLSEWHRDHVRRRYPFLEGKLTRTRNGIFLPWLQGPELERAPRVLYTSSPDRGLDVLLELWPQVRDRVPDAQLAHCYSPVYDSVADQNPDIARHREKIRELGDQPGVQPLQPMPQQDLARLMRQSRVWAHPSWCTPAAERFHETSCIGAMEAQAAGCWPVASNWGALRETVVEGSLVSGGGPSDRQWRNRFVSALIDGLTVDHHDQRAQAHGWGWEGVAEQFAVLCAPQRSQDAADDLESARANGMAAVFAALDD